MGWGLVSGLVVCALLILDGAVCLLFLERFESRLHELLPRVNVPALAVIEILAGGLTAILLLWIR